MKGSVSSTPSDISQETGPCDHSYTWQASLSVSKSELFPLQKSLLECASEPSLALTVPCATRPIMVLYALCCSLVPYAVAWCPMLVLHALCWYFICIISFYQ